MRKNYSKKYDNNCVCKFCGNPGSTRYQGYCQACYKYFVLDHKEVYPTPSPGEVAYAPNGDVVCPICGKAFRKLGGHLYLSHHLTCDVAFKNFEWHRRRVKASNISYRVHMHDVQDPKTITDNLLVKGKFTQFGKSNGNPLALNTKAVKSRCSGCAYLISKDGKSWDCDCYEKPCKFVIHCGQFSDDGDAQ